MLYRPLGHSGMALSAVGLRVNWEAVRHDKNRLSALLVAALENGVNTYHFDYVDAEMFKVAAEVFSAVARKLLFIGVTAHGVPHSAQSTSYNLAKLRERLKVAIKGSGFGYLDLVQFYNPINSGTPDESWAFLKSLREARMVRLFGAEVPDADLRRLIDSSQFHVIRTDFDLDTTWDKRHLIDLAQSRGISLFGGRYFPANYQRKEEVIPKSARSGWFFSKPEDPLSAAGTYAFLYQTQGWTAEELCLGYALHQSGLTTVFIEPTSVEALNLLTAVPERHLPPSVPAQIEMARFTDHPPKQRA